MLSMTGFGRGSSDSADHGLKIEIELRSVNRKNLDAFVSAPRKWSGIEQRCHEWLKDSYQRGRVNVQIKVESQSGSQSGLVWNAHTMQENIDRLRNFANENGYPFEVTGPLLLDLAKTLKDSSGLPDWREIEEPIKSAFEHALVDINTMRAREGKILATDLLERIAELDTLRENIAGEATGVTDKYRNALLERLNQLDLELDINDERVLKEIALFADRSDISEELVRLKCHFEQFREFIKSDQATGRKMDFLCQEIHREFNTIGSKSTRIEITRSVIESKNALERIREQVQNIE